MSRRLDDLSVRFKPLAIELLARSVEQGIAIMVIETRRTPEQHAANLANGVSWTAHSKHLDGDAIDICPFYQYSLHGTDKLQWDGTDPAWTALGQIGEGLGLRWGGRWAQKDFGHFEYLAPAVPGVRA